MFADTDADEELFEDNPEEYIRRDIEGSGITLVIGLHFVHHYKLQFVDRIDFKQLLYVMMMCALNEDC